MGLCGSYNCGCAITSTPAVSGAVGGSYPTINVDGGGEPNNPWDLTLDTNWVNALVNPASVSLGNSVGQVIANGGSGQAVTFDTEYWDVGGLHAGGAPTRITIPANWGGKWLVNYTITYPAFAAGLRYAWMRLNGVASYRISYSLGFGGAGYGGFLNGTSQLALVPGDYIELITQQDSGGPLALQGNDSATHLIEFSATWLAA